jgi:hypothetical protein
VERTRVLTDFFPSLFQLLPIFLYAETHYRFRYFISFLRKHEPEIIADAPFRLDPDQPLPLLILVKDAHLFPITIDGITLRIQKDGKILFEKKLLNSSLRIGDKLWWNIFKIDLHGIAGALECDVLFEIDHGKKKLYYHTDNHRTSSHRPLKVFISQAPLPHFDHLYFGECHSHSSYTDDQVEFGSPLQASVQLCKSQGLSFFCVTDHSYDLDDSIDNYLVQDPQLPKWRLLQREVDTLNSQFQDFIVVRGEEVTCRNWKEQNVHLLLFGNRKYFYGSGDGAERWLQTKSENSISDIVKEIEPAVLSFAAHPKEHVSFLQRLLLGRGKWHKKDFQSAQLTGIQFINGYVSNGFSDGYRLWIETLLEGKKISMVAGNDAHGNFNRFRQIGIPFLKIREMDDQLFGKMRTGIFLESLSEEAILFALRSGKAIASDGPVANIVVDPPAHKISSLGNHYAGRRHSISLEVRSTSEYGFVDSVKIFIGHMGVAENELISEKLSSEYSYRRIFALEVLSQCYIRAEIWTSPRNSNDSHSHFCMTNPVWFSP